MRSILGNTDFSMSEPTPTLEAYVVSARKYRPKKFSDLIGQEAIVQVLTNAINNNRLPSAFILTGIRGVGKTTIARLIARGLNCVGVDGAGHETVNACGVCSSCISIDSDSHLDVIEMDAASRTGVDDVREVIESSKYKAVSARYKVYIIDEVHMLSKSAFNALLKTLEEPPLHVKFIFATTEIDRVPDTILSRCMRFDLKRINPITLKNYLLTIAKREGAEIEEEALTLILEAGEGSVRDSLSLLDQAVTLSNYKVSRAFVEDMLGRIRSDDLQHLLSLLTRGEIREALTQFSSFYERGADPLSILEDLLGIIHEVSVKKQMGASSEDPLHPFFNLSIPLLTRLWQVLLRGVSEIKQAPSSFDAAQMILIRVAYLKDVPSPEDLMELLKKVSDSTLDGHKKNVVLMQEKGHQMPSAAITQPIEVNSLQVPNDDNASQKTESAASEFEEQALKIFPGSKIEYIS
jgi:DNA polymerase-3 subunit gamma/tau